MSFLDLSSVCIYSSFPTYLNLLKIFFVSHCMITVHHLVILAPLSGEPRDNEMIFIPSSLHLVTSSLGKTLKCSIVMHSISTSDQSCF